MGHDIQKAKSTNRGSQTKISNIFPRREHTHIHKYTFSHTYQHSHLHNCILIYQRSITCKHLLESL